MQIATNIRKLRELKNFSQEYIANELNISQSTYAKIENRQIIPKIDRLKQIAIVLEVDVSTLLNTSNILAFNFQSKANQSEHTNNQYLELKELYENLIKQQQEEIDFLRKLISKDK